MTIHGHTRRTFLKHGAVCAAGAAVPIFGIAPQRAIVTPPIQPQQRSVDDPATKALVQRAIDAAISSGATYVDVRLTHHRIRDVEISRVIDREEMTVGVRALTDGYWGFAASPIWNAAEMIRLGKEAALQAKSNALGDRFERELAPTTAVIDGHWKTPVQIDPFEVPVAEIMDYLKSLMFYTERIPQASLIGRVKFEMRMQAFGSSLGSYCTQQRYLSQGNLGVTVRTIDFTNQLVSGIDALTPTGVGWELFKGQPLRDMIREVVEELRFDLSIPVLPVEIGRYETVIHANSVAPFISQTIGAATELDRAMGYEANADGTSYISNPIEMIGAFQLASPLLNITANRNTAGGAATVQWDDEGVAPSAFTLVSKGMLQDVSTTRESAMWLRDRYGKLGRTLQSHGCAFAESGLAAPLPTTPNLEMTPGTSSADFESLIGGIRSGLAFTNMNLSLDFQQLNGLGMGKVYEIKNGKRISRLMNAGILFRSPEFWKSLIAIGGPTSARRYGQKVTKGEPPQDSWHSVTAVPVVCKDLSIIDISRKA